MHARLHYKNPASKHNSLALSSRRTTWATASTSSTSWFPSRDLKVLIISPAFVVAGTLLVGATLCYIYIRARYVLISPNENNRRPTISIDGFFVAIKEVPLLDQGTRIQHLEHEIRLLSRLDHPNIVRYMGMHKGKDMLSIILERIGKGSLASLYKEYRLKEAQVSAYTKQILSGLIYLHQENVLHRDIKCSNILVHTDGSIKLADFGLAKELSNLSQARSMHGTGYWMDPEVARSDPYGLPADIWSLGCTVLEMMTGKPPYSNLEWVAAMFQIMKNVLPDIPSTLSSEARDFIASCVQLNADDRPSAAELMNHPFVQNRI